MILTAAHGLYKGGIWAKTTSIGALVGCDDLSKSNLLIAFPVFYTLDKYYMILSLSNEQTPHLIPDFVRDTK